MPAPSILLDTNIVVSAQLSPLGLPYRVYVLALERRLRLYVSAPILAEYESVLLRPKFNFPSVKVAESLALIRQNSTLIAPAMTLAVSPAPIFLLQEIAGIIPARGNPLGSSVHAN
jgi:putative PIN family toxin of toxin-antitoxin system